MIEVLCGACGSTQRFAEAAVPAAGKTVSCDQCKARIVIPPRSGPALPAIPSPVVGGGTGDVINLADLPAPKRQSALAGVAAPSRPAPVPPLGGRGIAPPKPLSGLPRPPALPPKESVPPPRTPPPATAPPMELGLLDMEAVDLPAPVGPTSRGLTDLPAPVGPTSRGLTDLPAPVGPTSRRLTDLPAPVGPTSRGLADLPAPVGPTSRGLADLPAPKRAPAPAAAPAVDDLGIDLPAPKRAPDDLGIDLPAPKRTVAASTFDRPDDLGIDLPAPKGAGADPELDLPPPRQAREDVALPKTTGTTDLPAPKGFFDDLPAPKAGAGSGVDLPAPKGFFDDLPGPRGAAPSGGLDLSVPPGPAKVDVPTPKGFFDDLAPPTAPKPATPAPKGFFDDLPGGTSPPTQRPGKGLDLDDLDLAPPTQPPQKGAVPPPGAAVAKPPAHAAPPTAPPAVGGKGTPLLELDEQPDQPALELDTPDRFGGLDLPPGPALGTVDTKPAASPGVVSFKPSAPAPAQIHAPAPAGLDLDVDETKRPRAPARPEPRAAASAAGAKGAKPAVAARKRRTIALVVALVVVGGGVGAVFYYQHWKAQQAATAARDRALAEARRQLAADTPDHWKRAAGAAGQVLQSDAKNEEALAIAVIGNLAGYLEDGANKKGRIAASDPLVETLRVRGAGSPLAEKALGLYGLVKNDREGAVKRLTAAAKKAPKDLDAQLFLGWALAATHDNTGAIAAFEAATAGKSRMVPATYGLGLVQLAAGDLDGARKSFTAVLDVRKDHIGAQIGIAAAMSTADYARRETELLAVLGRKDIDKADPRAVARGWALAGDDARRGKRVDAARDRYRKALALDPDCVQAKIGNAELALTEDRLDDAATALTEALEESPNDPVATLALAELDFRQKKLADASALLDKLPATALGASERGRRAMLAGRIQEAGGDVERALTSYAEAQTALGDLDITPTIAQVSLLGAMATAATDPAKRTEYTGRADALLASLEAKAQKDTDMALVLGRAYLAVGNGAAAQKWLEVVLAARKDDIEVHSQLAQALDLQQKPAEALQRLREAFELDPARADIGLDLATRYEASAMNDDAAAMYDKLLASPQATLDLRVHAGLFYARTGDAAAAAKQGAQVLAVEPDNAAGMFLSAEGLYAAGKWDEARALYKQAVAKDPKPLYQDGLGRAAEALGAAQNDGRYRDEALVAYEAAAAGDPKLLGSQLGRGRLHLDRREYEKALEAFEAARGIDPNQSDIAYGEGMAYSQLNNRALAIQWLSRAVQQKPRADAYYRLGLLYLDQNDGGKATAAYRQATRLARDEERSGKPPISWLTEALWQLGQLEENGGAEAAACEAYDAYLARNPTDQVKIRTVKTAKLGLHCR